MRGTWVDDGSQVTRGVELMPRTNIEEKAWGDVRFQVLANLLNIDHFSAIGRMANVWRWCTNTEKYELSAAEIEAAIGVNNSAFLLCESGLATRNDDMYYIHGTKGRIEWIKRCRKNGKLGGRKRKKPRGNPGVKGQVRSGQAIGVPLVGVKSKEKRAFKEQQSNSTNGVQELASHWCKSYEYKYSDPYPNIFGAQDKLLQLVDNGFGVEDLKSRIESFFHKPPSWVDGKPTIGAFVHSVGDYQKKRPRSIDHLPEDEEGYFGA